MRTVTKKDLVDRIAERSKIKQIVVKDILQRVLDEIVEEIGQGNRLEFREFGVFEPTRRAPRAAHNPRTLQRVPVPAKRTVKFKAGRILKQKLATLAATATSEADTEAATAMAQTGQPSPRAARFKPRPYTPQ